MGGEPKLGPPDPRGHAQKEEMMGNDGLLGKIKDMVD